MFLFWNIQISTSGFHFILYEGQSVRDGGWKPLLWQELTVALEFLIECKTYVE